MPSMLFTFRISVGAEKAVNHRYSLSGCSSPDTPAARERLKPLCFHFVDDKEAVATLHAQFMCESALS